MGRLKLFLGILVCAISFVGCSSGGGSVVVLLPDASGKVGKAEVSNSKGTALIEKAHETVSVNIEQKPKISGIMSAQEINDIFEIALAAEPIPPAHFFLNFYLGSDKMIEESKPVIQLILSDIGKRPSHQIVIRGHADRKGEDNSNYLLSGKRAARVKNILIKEGVSPENIKVTSHGEKLPLIQTADDVAEPLNRRVEVLVR